MLSTCLQIKEFRKEENIADELYHKIQSPGCDVQNEGLNTVPGHCWDGLLYYILYYLFLCKLNQHYYKRLNYH